MVQALAGLKRKAAPGSDGLTAEMIDSKSWWTSGSPCLIGAGSME